MTRGRKIGLGVGAVFAILIIIGIANSPSTPTLATVASVPASLADTSATTDIAINDCGTTNDLGWAVVRVRVYNSTNEPASYMITVSENDSRGDRLGEANGAVNSLAPGQTTMTELMGTASSGVTRCTVASVSRLPM